MSSPLKNILLYYLFLSFLAACASSEDSPSPVVVSISANNFSTSLDENPTNGDPIGSVSATASDNSALTYSLSNQNVAGAIAIDANTGQLSVADASAFDFETNPSITASYTASNGTESATATITITVNDLEELDPNAFVLTFETTGPNELIELPMSSGDYNVDWGDGNTSSNESGGVQHTYATAGTYQVIITGTFSSINYRFVGSDIRNRLKSIDQWGTTQWDRMDYAFASCTNVVLNASDTPDLSNVNTMSHMFFRAETFNGDISGWNVSNVNNMQSMFNGASSFNQDISDWDVSNVTNMNQMFERASAFNQDISSWDVSGVMFMNSMFFLASAFNQDISGWNVANVTNCINFDANSGLSASNRPSFPAGCD